MSTAERRKRERAQRRESIIDAAEQVFYDKGFPLTRMVDIARQTQLSKGALYQYFTSKEELLLAVSVRWRRELLEIFDRELARPATAVEHLHAMFEAIADVLGHHAGRLRLMLGAMATDAHFDRDSALYTEAREMGLGLLQRLTSTIERGKAEGTIRSDLDTVALMFHFWGSTVGLLLIATFAHLDPETEAFGKLDLQQLLHSFLDLLGAAIAPHPAATTSPKQGVTS